MRERIAINPNIHFGKPCIAGTRITVQNVLELLKEGIAFKQIIQDYYPDLTIEDLHPYIQDESLNEYDGLTREDIQACLRSSI
jgi:uncharacterized protein (DUF433 family)